MLPEMVWQIEHPLRKIFSGFILDCFYTSIWQRLSIKNGQTAMKTLRFSIPENLIAVNGPKPPYGILVPEGKPDLHALPPEAAGDYIGFIKNQLTELLTNYGPIDILWIDQYKNSYTFSHWQEIRTHIKSIQPHCLVIGNNAHDLRETDVYSCEFPFDPEGIPHEGNTKPSEVCDVISGSWFWNSAGKPGDVKSSRKIVEMLKLCNERNANYLLNVPPDRDGMISGEHLKRMREIGELLKATPSGTRRN